MIIRNKISEQIQSIDDKTMAADVIRNLMKQQKETGTGTLARMIKQDTTIILPECKKLRESQILVGFLGYGGALYYHPKYGKLVHKKIEKIVEEFEKAGLTEEEIKAEMQKIFKEAKFLGRPREWKWRVKNGWEILST